ncbi:Ig-like domain-containing protein [Thermococcus sp.]|nr:Ig-like domain-containing protein [Thermococcus sp.]
MRKALLALMTIMLLLSSGMVYSEGFKTAKMGDYGVYLYFQGVLKEFNDVLGGLPGNESTGYTVEDFVNQTALIMNVVEEYSAFGIPRSSVTVATQFDYLGKDAMAFYRDKIRFKGEMKAGEYIKARNTLIEMKGILNDMAGRVDTLSRMEFKEKNGTIVRFNLSETVVRLDGLRSLVREWEEVLNRLEGPKEFSIYLQTPRVILNESASFYGYRLNLTNVTVFIDGAPYEPKVKGNSFYLNHTFTEPGIHVVYAVALNGSAVVKSNVLTVRVRRIPTVIAAHQEGRYITGVLMGYTGRGLPDETLTIRVGGKNYSVETSGSGNFSFSLPGSFKSCNVTVIFNGNGGYAPSAVAVAVRPPKKRLSIVITSASRDVKEGPVEIEGRIIGTKEMIPVEVYIDGNLSSVVGVAPNFTLTVTLERGTHTVYLRFPGNEEFAESTSNSLKFNVRAESYTRRIAMLVALLALGALGYWAMSRVKPKPKEGPSQTVPQKKAWEEAETADPVSAYRVVYRTLLRVYRLPRSTTPRELLSRFKNAPFGKWLREATGFHEMVFYRGTKLRAREVLRALKAVAMTIVSIFVGDEL